MAIKAINDSAGPNGIILYLLIFGAYLRILSGDLLPVIIAKRIEAIRFIIKEI